MRPQSYDEITRFGEDANTAIPTGRLKKRPIPTRQRLFPLHSSEKKRLINLTFVENPIGGETD